MNIFSISLRPSLLFSLQLIFPLNYLVHFRFNYIYIEYTRHIKNFILSCYIDILMSRRFQYISLYVKLIHAFFFMLFFSINIPQGTCVLIHRTITWNNPPDLL